MGMFSEAKWLCNECDFHYSEYGPQYECPSCGSEDIELDYFEEDGEDA